MQKNSEEATLMVNGYKFNVWGKFDNFYDAANFVYGPNWQQLGQVWVHWGPTGGELVYSIHTQPNRLLIPNHNGPRSSSPP